MKIIDSDLFNTRKPYNDYYDNISLDSQNNYLRLYSIYNDLLIQYLIKKYDLKAYDDMLKKSNKNFINVDTLDMDLYQYASSEYLSFLYLRNNINLENLTKEEIQFLNNITNTSLTNEYEEFIENTYKKVILSNKGYTMYGPDNSKYLKDSNSIIIGLRHKGIDLNSNNEEEINTFMKQSNYLKLFIPELERQLNERNKDKFNVIEYNDYSIVKRNNNSHKIL